MVVLVVVMIPGSKNNNGIFSVWLPPLNADRIVIWVCWFLGRVGNKRTQRKTLGARTRSNRLTNASRIQRHIWGRKCSHHCTIPEARGDSQVSCENFKMSCVGTFLVLYLSFISLLEIHLTLLLFVTISFECCLYYHVPCQNLPWQGLTPEGILAVYMTKGRGVRQSFILWIQTNTWALNFTPKKIPGIKIFYPKKYKT